MPDAMEAASGADTSISGTLRPSCRASSVSCCARACSASAESRWRTSDRYLASSRADGDVMVVYVQVAATPNQRARMDEGLGAMRMRSIHDSRGRTRLVHGTTTVDEITAYTDSIRPGKG